MPRKKKSKAKTTVDKKQNFRINRIERLLAPEVKVITTAPGPTAFTTGGVIYSPFPVLGQTSLTRIGSRVNFIGADIHIICLNQSVAGDYIRISGGVDRSVNGQAFSLAQLYQLTGLEYLSGFNPDTVGGKECPYEGWAGIKNSKRFQVLFDVQKHLPASCAVGGTPPFNNPKSYANIRKKLKLDCETTFQANAGAITDVTDRIPFVLLFASGTNTTHNTCINWYYVDA